MYAYYKINMFKPIKLTQNEFTEYLQFG